MKKMFVVALVSIMATGLSAQNAQTSAKPTKNEVKPADVVLKNAVDSVNYANAVFFAANLRKQLGDDIRPELLLAAVRSALNGEPAVMSPEAAATYANTYGINKNKAEGRKYMAMNKTKAGVMTTPSGLQYEILKKGTGTVSPVATSRVEVHYHGTLLDGTIFDSSVQRGQTATFGLNQVIKGWTEGVSYMREGDKFKFTIPSELAYGDRSAPGGKIKPGSTLIFEVELIKIVQQ
jgi:FKBP-type peptidyl-prolyl cis-trans isomerase